MRSRLKQGLLAMSRKVTVLFPKVEVSAASYIPGSVYFT